MIVKWLRAALQDLGLLLIRSMVGVIFVYHGSQKLFGLFDGPGLAGFTAFLQQLGIPWPAYVTVLVATAEFLGGLALILGMWTRVAAVPLLVTMTGAIVLVHGEAFSLQRNGMEYPLTLGVVLLGLIVAGPGKIACAGPWMRWRQWLAARRSEVSEAATVPGPQTTKREKRTAPAAPTRQPAAENPPFVSRPAPSPMYKSATADKSPAPPAEKTTGPSVTVGATTTKTAARSLSTMDELNRAEQLGEQRSVASDRVAPVQRAGAAQRDYSSV